ncbi:hypothetical protein ACQKL5_07720 [Peribacillus sp. NPDC097675]|uniref:hypothetical protein n=1 Tax=Peribacillus sp. NPDC097675 TaxID=3390618 RepID=UPI003D067848
MRKCRKIVMGLLVVCSLAACDAQNMIQEGKSQVQETKEGKDTVKSNEAPSYNSPTYYGSHLYNHWISSDSFLIIMRDERSTYTLQRITKNEVEPLRHFEIVEPTESTITGILYNEEKRNRTSFFTLKLNEDKKELTVTMPNEKPITYKETDKNPREFNPNYEGESFDSLDN